jgi:hypothetical protein
VLVKPADSVPFTSPGGTEQVSWDAAWWWARPEGVLQINLASRLAKSPELLAPYSVRSPLWSGHTVVLNPAVPRTDEVVGSPEASRFISILGAAWLLMGQRNVSDVRVIADHTASSRASAAPMTPSLILLVELRRREPAPRQSISGGRPARITTSGRLSRSGANKPAGPLKTFDHAAYTCCEVAVCRFVFRTAN